MLMLPSRCIIDAGRALISHPLGAVFVRWGTPRDPHPPALLKRERTEGRKRRENFTSIKMLHTHKLWLTNLQPEVTRNLQPELRGLRGYLGTSQETRSLNQEDCKAALGIHKKSAAWTKRIAQILQGFTRNLVARAQKKFTLHHTLGRSKRTISADGCCGQRSFAFHHTTCLPIWHARSPQRVAQGQTRPAFRHTFGCPTRRRG